MIATIVTQAYQRYRAGGLVIGPGTGTSDEIQALLSHGESVNTEEETARIIALGQGDYDAGRAKVTELLKSRRAAQQAMLNQYDILIKEAIMSARGAAGASREAILQAIQGKYGFAPSAEDLDTVLGQDEDFVETSGGIWNYLPWWLGGTQVSKKPPVRAPVARKSPNLGPKRVIGKNIATPKKQATPKQATAAKTKATPEKKQTLNKKATPEKAATPETPPLTKMCAEAILSLKDRTGSSKHAIKAYILVKYGLEPEGAAVRAALSNTKWFLKNKDSYKLSDEGKEMME